MIDSNKYLGCFLGLAIGDAYGASHEGGPIERTLWKLIGKTKDGKLRYTDDTQMSMDLAHSFLKNKEINQDHLASTFAASYQWSRGYGVSVGKLLKKIQKGAQWQDVNCLKYPEGSLGSGAAMRAPILALCYPDNLIALNENVIKASEITHAHHHAIKGAQLIAFVCSSVLKNETTEDILKILPDQCDSVLFRNKIISCIELLGQIKAATTSEIKNRLGNGIIASESCVTAIYFGLKFRNQNIENMLEQIFHMGGDTDTIGSMAGAIWGIHNGGTSLKEQAQEIENIEKITLLSEQLYAFYQNK